MYVCVCVCGGRGGWRVCVSGWCMYVASGDEMKDSV